MLDQAKQILTEVFGYQSFRSPQDQIIKTVLKGNDAMVIMPTGGGKSLCYQIPALVMPNTAIVVSPLIALMEDQVQALRGNGVEAIAYHSAMDRSTLDKIYEKLDANLLKVIYVSPEKINSQEFSNILNLAKVDLFAIDEAHCVSVWGNDFRPDYVQLSQLKKRYPQTPLIALTATADEATRTDIQHKLGIKTAEVFISSFERTNIFVECRSGQQRQQQIEEFISYQNGNAGIIYCLSKKSCEKTSDKLKSLGYKSDFYHAGRSSADRNRVQQAFQNDDLQIICATIAFGMGIDKSNIKWIIHFNMPKNIEGYYQEIGRAGRDGDDAHTIMFYSWADMSLLTKFIDDSPAASDFKELQRSKLDRIWELATGASCRTNMILSYFGEFRSEPCGHCDNCKNPPKTFDGKIISQKAISAVIRGRESMSFNLLIDVLRGSMKQEVQALGLQHIKTFGAGRQFTFIEWKHYLTQVINQGLLKVDYTDGAKLKCTPLSKKAVMGDLDIALTKWSPVKTTPKPVKLEIDLGQMSQGLFNELKNWRTTQAQKKRVPAYIIMSDKVLKAIASAKPTNTAALLGIDGIGTKKQRDYGEDLINIVLKH